VNDLQRFRECMEYGAVDHVPFWDWGAWPETIERWKSDGFDPNRNPAAICDQRQWVGHWFFPNPPFTREVVSEDAETITYVNHEGIVIRERKDNRYSSMPLAATRCALRPLPLLHGAVVGPGERPAVIPRGGGPI